jgi:hypothetical protein
MRAAKAEGAAEAVVGEAVVVAVERGEVADESWTRHDET